ncbi:uncharacterized protein LOC110853098 [Folsomia candida]|uniref:uncharacterized protein LOC110853098 n=1 Tax=Folsomia candida TaxID=158441 RepID=UPI000B8F6173|nr:uncharacterized protein LOC110853098 [Folsomia candida]
MGQTLPTMDNLAAGDGELFVQELRVLGDQGAGAGDLLFGGQGDDNAAAGELLLVQGQGDENAAADNRLLDGQGDAPPATEVTHVPLFEHRSFADNYVVASCILSHLADVEVRGLRSVCKTWAAAGGVILSRRNGGNKRAYLTFERERDAKRKIGRLNKLLARTTTPRYLLPANYAAMGISTTCMRSKTDVRATPTFQLFLERYGKYVKSVEFHRTSARPDDNLMFDDLKTILQTCENLTDFAFLPYKATFTFVNRGPHHQQQQLREQMVTTFRQNLVWTPIRAAISLSVAMGPLKITTLILHICHPRHLAVLITLCPNLKDLAFLAPNVETRTSAQVLADWEGFQDAVNEIGGINTIESLTLQEWDLVPNVEMKNLQTIKLSMRRGISTLPVSQKISYLTIYPQVRNVDLYLYQPRPSLAENGAIHRFINRFPGMTTLLVDIKPSPGVVADWTPFQQQEHLHAIANGHLFNPVECAINYNVKNLFILNLQLFEFHVHPPSSQSGNLSLTLPKCARTWKISQFLSKAHPDILQDRSPCRTNWTRSSKLLKNGGN